MKHGKGRLERMLRSGWKSKKLEEPSMKDRDILGTVNRQETTLEAEKRVKVKYSSGIWKMTNATKAAKAAEAALRFTAAWRDKRICLTCLLHQVKQQGDIRSCQDLSYSSQVIWNDLHNTSFARSCGLVFTWT